MLSWLAGFEQQGYFQELELDVVSVISGKTALLFIECVT